MTHPEIYDLIKTGLIRGYRQNILLLSSHHNFLSAVREYLLTVNVAQTFLDWNEDQRYRIQIEYPVKHFFNNAFMESVWTAINYFTSSTRIQREPHSPTDKLCQKIDIAVTELQPDQFANNDERVLVGIELKAINKSEENIVKDAERMAKAMVKVDPVSPNSIQFCFCGFLRRLDKDEEMVTEEFIQQKMIELDQRWNKIVHDLNNTYKTLLFSCAFFDVVDIKFEEIMKMHQGLGSDAGEVAEDTGVVKGGILLIERR